VTRSSAARRVAIDRTLFRCAVALCALAGIGWNASLAAADLRESAASSFERYARVTEQRLDQEERGAAPFLFTDRLPEADRREVYRALDRGDVVSRRVEAPPPAGSLEFPGALCHDWVGTVFMPGVTVDQVIGLMQSYDRYAEIYRPAVRRSRLIEHQDGHFKASLQLFMKKGISVALNTEVDVRYVRISPSRAQVRSSSTRIAEVDSLDSPGEQEKPVGHDNGFLWRFNNYCAVEERGPGPERAAGTYVQCQSLSLSRSVPLGLGWLIGPFVSSIPRESMEFTLRTMRSTLTTGRPANVPPPGR